MLRQFVPEPGLGSILDKLNFARPDLYPANNLKK
jgi:hypothetical protein